MNNLDDPAYNNDRQNNSSTNPAYVKYSPGVLYGRENATLHNIIGNVPFRNFLVSEHNKNSEEYPDIIRDYGNAALAAATATAAVTHKRTLSSLRKEISQKSDDTGDDGLVGNNRENAAYAAAAAVIAHKRALSSLREKLLQNLDDDGGNRNNAAAAAVGHERALGLSGEKQNATKKRRRIGLAGSSLGTTHMQHPLQIPFPNAWSDFGRLDRIRRIQQQLLRASNPKAQQQQETAFNNPTVPVHNMEALLLREQQHRSEAENDDSEQILRVSNNNISAQHEGFVFPERRCFEAAVGALLLGGEQSPTTKKKGDAATATISRRILDGQNNNNPARVKALSHISSKSSNNGANNRLNVSDRNSATGGLSSSPKNKSERTPNNNNNAQPVSPENESKRRPDNSSNDNNTPSDDDVIIGRGSKCYYHAGNQKLRRLVASRLEEYSGASSQKDKSRIISSIIEELRRSGNSKTNNVSFLKLHPESKRWFDVGDALAREKISQTFRDALHENYKSSTKYKKKRKKEQQQQQQQQQQQILSSAATNNNRQQELLS